MYIISHWSDELLNLMVEKLIERKKRGAEAIEDARLGRHRVSVEELGFESGGAIKYDKGE